MILVKYAIEINSLVKKFGDFTAIKNISFNVKEGEIFGLLGPNGSGKTTTLNILLGLLNPTSGSVKLYGKDVHDNLEESKQMLGFMTQETLVEQDLTPRQNLEIFGELYHIKDVDKRVEEGLEYAELTDFADYKAGVMSGGMQRRLALARSMMNNPRVIILDEPTTGLDVQNRSAIWDKIKDMNKKGITVLLTTQYLEEADTLCDRIAIIDHGKIKIIGTPSELKSSVSEGNVIEIIPKKEFIDKVVTVLKKYNLNPKVKVDVITVAIEKDNIKKFSEIINDIIKEKIPILSVSMHLPTLDDVFIKLTGSGLKDEAK